MDLYAMTLDRVDSNGELRKFPRCGRAGSTHMYKKCWQETLNDLGLCYHTELKRLDYVAEEHGDVYLFDAERFMHDSFTLVSD